MRPPIDVAMRVSPQLSDVIEKMVNDPDREQSPTLGEVRNSMQETIGPVAAQVASLHPQDRTSMTVELDELIEEYGEEALAMDFIAAKASEALSRVIEAAMDDPSLPEEPTLESVREAIINGLTARLIGQGTLEPEEDATLLGEIDALIQRYGPDAIAEDFIRFE
jgi:hypothetical protein